MKRWKYSLFSKVLQEVGRIDILVNNAIWYFKTFEDASMGEVKDMFQVNVFGLVACTKAATLYGKQERRTYY